MIFYCSVLFGREAAELIKTMEIYMPRETGLGRSLPCPVAPNPILVMKGERWLSTHSGLYWDKILGLLHPTECPIPSIIIPVHSTRSARSYRWDMVMKHFIKPKIF